MKCPYCNFEESKVIDTRTTDDGSKIRRRRECLSCKKRFSTYEIIETIPIIVIKKDGKRETFDRNKLFRGLLKSCEKRPIKLEALEEIVDKIETALQSNQDNEVPSDTIGEYAMKYLKELDQVAYVRFASVYRQFKDIDSFKEELERLFDK